MRYFLAESVFNLPQPVPADEIGKTYVPAHEKHLAAAIEKGQVLLAGPKTEEGGGLMIARFESREELDAFLARDPFVTSGIAYFRVKEFKLKDRSDRVLDW